MKSDAVQQNWLGFKNQVIPEESPKIQKIEMEKAFYAGSATILSYLLNLDFNQPSDCTEKLKNLEIEIETYFANL